MTTGKQPRTQHASTAMLFIGTQKLLVNVSDLTRQARVLGRLANDRHMSTTQITAIEGIWNFLHAILDATDTEAAKKITQ